MKKACQYETHKKSAFIHNGQAKLGMLGNSVGKILHGMEISNEWVRLVKADSKTRKWQRVYSLP
jgi:hypothetical protein